MSTAFLVDNILSDKEIGCVSIESDTESDATSDLKDSCGSPESGEINLSNHHHPHHPDHRSPHYRFQYNIQHLNRAHASPSTTAIEHGVCDEHRPNSIHRVSDRILSTYNTMMLRNDSITADDHLDDSSSNLIEMCCSKCGHFQQLTKRGGGGGDDCHNDIDIDFKCDKCECPDGVITTATATTTTTTKEPTTTILKDSAKPILKFSVSAILGDRKECVKTRTGKQRRQHYSLFISSSRSSESPPLNQMNIFE